MLLCSLVAGNQSMIISYYLILPNLVLSCLLLSCLVLSCLVLSCLVLSCLVFTNLTYVSILIRSSTFSHKFYLYPFLSFDSTLLTHLLTYLLTYSHTNLFLFHKRLFNQLFFMHFINCIT